MAASPRHLLDMTADEVRAWIEGHGQPSYRAGQVRRWVFADRAQTFEQMTNLPAPLRAAMSAELTLWAGEIEKHTKAADRTEKLLLKLSGGTGGGEGGLIECVLLREGQRRSICISSQVGCAMGCVFCASGLEGLERNLTTGEIIEQMLRLQALLPPSERLSHIVVMGMGEPLANVDNVLAALEEASAPDGLGISPRRITISTVGVPRAIEKLADLGCQYNLAVSLHAPDDELRSRLVPVNKGTGLSAILAAADRYFEASGRRLTYEYVLLGGLNDRPRHARALARLLEGRTALLNVIPYNRVEGLPYETPTAEAIKSFRDTLKSEGINVQLRKRKGDEIDAACGQLRKRALSSQLSAVSCQPESD